ncbi:hypothetical protein YPPY56_2289, partial [Yersinia pestis PY-56]
MFSGCVEVAQS